MQWRRWYTAWRHWARLGFGAGEGRLLAEWRALKSAWWTRRLYR
jgi:hypothetical protein